MPERSIDFFYLEIDKQKGAIADSRLALEYKPLENISLGLAWGKFRATVESQEESSSIPGADFKGVFKFQTVEFSLFLKGAY